MIPIINPKPVLVRAYTRFRYGRIEHVIKHVRSLPRH